MHWRIDAVGVTVDTMRAAMESQNPFLKPLGPPGDAWMDAITPEMKAQVKKAIDAVCAATEVMQKQEHAKVIEVSEAALTPILQAGSLYNASCSGHDETHIDGVGARFAMMVDRIVPKVADTEILPPTKILLGEDTANAGEVGLGNRIV
jgi:hypothetical protein